MWRKQNTPVLLHRTESVTASLKTQPIGLFIGEKCTYQEIRKLYCRAANPEKTILLQDTWTPVSSAALPRRDKHWKLPKTSIHRWIQKTGYIHTMDDDSSRNTKEIVSLAATLKDPHTDSRKPDGERWRVYTGQHSVESKSNTNELVSPAETDSQTETSNWDLAKGCLERGEM